MTVVNYFDFNRQLAERQTRKPRQQFRKSGLLLPRQQTVARLACWLQQPPRVTRSEPDEAPEGSVTSPVETLSYQSQHHSNTFPPLTRVTVASIICINFIICMTVFMLITYGKHIADIKFNLLLLFFMYNLAKKVIHLHKISSIIWGFYANSKNSFYRCIKF